MLPLHHIRKRKRKEKPTKGALDYAVYAASILGPLTALPQLRDLYVLKTTGVSAVSYTGYTALSLLWLYYGTVHKDKPIIISNTLWVVANGLILVGTVMR